MFNDKLQGENWRILLKTSLNLLQNGSPSLAVRLVDAGFSDQELGMLAEGEGPAQNFKVQIREGSIRQRSVAARVAMIREDAKANLISPDTYQRAMSDAGIDMPLTDGTRTMQGSRAQGHECSGWRGIHAAPARSTKSGFAQRVQACYGRSKMRRRGACWTCGGDRIADAERRHGRGSATVHGTGDASADRRCGIGWYGVDQMTGWIRFWCVAGSGRWGASEPLTLEMRSCE